MPPSYPAVPFEATMPHLWENVFLVIVGVPTVLATLWALRTWRRTGDPLYAVVMLGGLACALLEPLVDLLGMCWYPRGSQFEVFELMGRPIPLFAVLGYMMTFGGATMAAIEVLRRKGPQALWATWVATVLFTAIFEFFAVRTGSYLYYGDQPLRLFGWPSWWGPVYSLVVISSAVVIAALRPYLRGWRVLAVVLLIPAMDGAANAAAAWPVWTTNWSDVPWAARHLSGVLTYALAALFVWLLISVAQHGSRPIPKGSVDDWPESDVKQGQSEEKATTR